MSDDGHRSSNGLCVVLHGAIDGDPAALEEIVSRFAPALALQLTHRGVPRLEWTSYLRRIFTSDLARLVGLATDDRKAETRILHFLGRVQLARVSADLAAAGDSLQGRTPECLPAIPDWPRAEPSGECVEAVESALRRSLSGPAFADLLALGDEAREHYVTANVEGWSAP